MTYFLDLGTTKAACMAAEVGQHGEIVATAAAQTNCKGLFRSCITDLDLTSQAIGEVIRRVRSTTGEQPNTLVVNINGAHIESMNAQGLVPIYPRSRLITREDVLHVINHSRQLMPLPDREQIQALPREFRVDGVKGVQKPIGMSGGRLEVVTHIVTVSEPQRVNIEKAVQMAGFKVDQIIVQPVASGLGVTREEDREAGCVVVDMGAGCTSISIFQGQGLIYSCVLPAGSNLITSDLSKLLKTSIDEAERIKVSFGNAMGSTVQQSDTVEVLQIGQSQPRHLERRVLCEIIESRAREIAIMIRQQIDKSGMNGLLPGGILLCGGGSKLTGIQELFSAVIPHMQVRLGEPHILGPASAVVCKPEWAAIAGMADFALQHEEDEIVPANGSDTWKTKIRTLKALFTAKA